VIPLYPTIVESPLGKILKSDSKQALRITSLYFDSIKGFPKVIFYLTVPAKIYGSCST
jgi:hypothetical protein